MTKSFAYPDTCLLVPLFVEEKGTIAATRMFAEFTKSGRIPFLVSELTCLEFNSALAKSARTGSLTKEKAHLAIVRFAAFARDKTIVVPVQTDDFTTAQKFIAEQTTSLRTLDALHLAVAQANNCTLITADKQLAAAAAVFEVGHYFVPQE